ncbi:MAG: HlyD family secretion protein [Marinilabiliales bacterium]|nr:HlyD family secretion protein [Marinilabiliales bacterium]
MSGKIRDVNVSEGEYVKEGQMLFELADDINLWVEALFLMIQGSSDPEWMLRNFLLLTRMPI